MLQANPNLTPNLVKAILQYTAQQYQPATTRSRRAPASSNTLGAVRLAQFYKRQHGRRRTCRSQAIWSQHIIWGNHLLCGGYLNPHGNAWTTDDSRCWGTLADDNIVWGTGGDNIVWGTDCGDGWTTSCGAPATQRRQHRLGHAAATTTSSGAPRGDDNIVWGTGGDDNIVWGTAATTTSSGAPHGDDNIVWGTDCGGADCDNIVWGTAGDDNIVWGTAGDGDNIVWGTPATTTSCGARAATTTSSGAPAATTTSSGARQPTRTPPGAAPAKTR